ncbi:MAG: hypothetical protein PUA90_01870 [bacterium]|nr:hypothetical protein [bacterium]
MNKSFNDLFNLNPRLSTSVAFILGLILVDNLNTSEQNLVGNWIILVGQTILTNASCQNLIESRVQGTKVNINSKEIKCVYNPVMYDINKIKKIINEFYPKNNTEIDTLYKIINELKDKIEEIKKD